MLPCSVSRQRFGLRHVAYCLRRVRSEGIVERDAINTQGFWLLWLATYLLMSLICFVAYYRDKQCAIRGRRRTPETRLHLYELLGGWPGGLLAQRLIRHKNRKLAYQLRFWSIVLLHVGITGFLIDF